MSTDDSEPTGYIPAAADRAGLSIIETIQRAYRRGSILRSAPIHHPDPGPLDPTADLLECGAMSVDVRTDEKTVMLAEPDVEAPEDHGEAYIMIDQDDLVDLPWWGEPAVWRDE